MQVVPSKDSNYLLSSKDLLDKLINQYNTMRQKDTVERDAEIALMIKHEVENILMKIMIDFY